jgi:hypothetical protein
MDSFRNLLTDCQCPRRQKAHPLHANADTIRCPGASGVSGIRNRRAASSSARQSTRPDCNRDRRLISPPTASRAVAGFMTWCDANRVGSITAVQPLPVAAWIEQQTREHAAPTVKRRLAALRHLFDWLVTGQVMPTNPAGSVRGPAHVVTVGKTPVLAPEEARALIDRIEITTPVGLRDRALVGLMVFSFARIGAALGMKVEDVFTQNRRSGCGCAKRAARHTPCRATTTLRPTSPPASRARGSPKIPRGRCFVPSAAAPVCRRVPPAPGQRLRDDRKARGGARPRDQTR